MLSCVDDNKELVDEDGLVNTFDRVIDEEVSVVVIN
jgi:hypothetical protein